MRKTIIGLCSPMLFSGALYASQDVSFILQEPCTGLVCGAEPRYLEFVVKNNRNANIGIESSEIIIPSNFDDDFRDITELMQVVGGTCVPNVVLGPYQTCSVIVEIDPRALDCDSETILTGEIDRQLVLDVETAQAFLYSDPISCEVSALGTAGDFSLLGPSIFNEEDDSILVNSPAYVEQDVANTDELGFLTDNIDYGPDAEEFGPNDDITIIANDDLERAFAQFYQLQDECTYLDHDLADNGAISPGIYCFDEDAPVVVSGEVTLCGNGESCMSDDIQDTNNQFIFIIDYQDELKPDYPVLVALEDSSIVLNGVNANDVFWVVTNSVETHSGCEFAGSILSLGGFESENDGEGCAFDGRILVVGDDDREAVNDAEVEPTSPVIELNGDSIYNPADDFTR